MNKISERTGTSEVIEAEKKLCIFQNCFSYKIINDEQDSVSFDTNIFMTLSFNFSKTDIFSKTVALNGVLGVFVSAGSIVEDNHI